MKYILLFLLSVSAWADGGYVNVGNGILNPNSCPATQFANGIDQNGLLSCALPGAVGFVTAVTGTTPINSSGGSTPNITIDNAAADGTTKGAASFTAADFNSSSGLISIDYTNGQAATTSLKGFLTSTDWNTFNGKQASGNYITALTGDITATGPGSVAATLATVNSNVGSFTNSNITVNAKGLVTAASSGTAPVTSVTGTSPIASSGGATPAISIADAVADGATKGAASFTAADFDSSSGNISIDYTNGQSASTSLKGFLTSTDWNTFNGKQAAGNYITALTGDATASGPGSAALTLATVNANVGTFGSSTSIPTFTVNAKGLITAASGNAVIAPAGTLTGTTLASNVVTSSLTSVGTIATGTWNGTTIAVANGGTSLTTLTANNVILGNGSSAPLFVAPGTSGNVLTSNGTTWTSATPAATLGFIGSAYFATTASCTWSLTSTSLASLTTTSACPGPTIDSNPGVGTIQTTDTDLPQVTVNGLAAGTYAVTFDGYSGTTTADYSVFTINDGTTTSPMRGFASDAGSNESSQFHVTAYFTESAGNVTFTLYASSATGTISVKNQRDNVQTSFSIVRVR